MAIDAVDRSNLDFLDFNILFIVDDIRNWFSHPEDANTILTTSFWHQVEDFLYSERDIAIEQAYEWQNEISAMNSARQRELVDEMRGW